MVWGARWEEQGGVRLDVLSETVVGLLRGLDQKAEGAVDALVCFE